MKKQQQKHQQQTKRPGDHFYHEAKEQGFLARSVFKLQEIDQKYRLFPQNRREPFFVIDLGCAPGSWLQYVIKKLNKDDRVVGIDLNNITISDEHIIFFQRDINDVTSEELFNAIKTDKRFNMVLSDMAPRTSGIKSADQLRSAELCREALRVAISTLKKDGKFVIKVFQSNELKALTNDIKKYFTDVNIFKPESSRKESFEIYIVATGFQHK
ncbi:MAG: RlmE family RNA methyltransferase [Proteobacteria bacterium]|nr:RlmE family RNA methyltransferase [Pseudomonadota bacterium]